MRVNSTVGGMGGRKPNLVLCWSPHSGDEALLEIGCEAREGPHQSIHGACGQVSRYVLVQKKQTASRQSASPRLPGGYDPGSMAEVRLGGSGL